MIFLKKAKFLLVLFIFAMGTTAFAQSDERITDTELKQFVAAFQDVQMEGQKAQQKMMGIIEEEGMEVARFSEIQKASANANAAIDATATEMEAYENIIAEIETMQPTIEAKMEAHVASSGLAIERYQAIATQLQTDQQLQERIKTLTQK
ncbi:MAG: hypothetical protein CMC08_02325 [Flavobacteriaceae bacterium]|nr:hypothetical protein [Flavobacteriaceae bacterium]|tara:strand:- start:161 stop:610 length:450 start_codon:yes stop_codon:yes gene_type:complete